MTTIDSSSAGRGGAVKLLEPLLAIGMVFMLAGAVAPILDRPGLGLLGDTRPAVDAVVDFDVDFGDRFETRSGDDGVVVDAATSQAPVEIGAPVTAHFVFVEPSASQRVIWLIPSVLPPLLALAATWQVFAIVRTARRGDPFVAENERRLWILAFLIGLGGTLWSMVSGFSEMLLLQRSAAADMTEIAATISFLPAIIGLGVAVLASVWRVGVDLRDDVDGMV